MTTGRRSRRGPKRDLGPAAPSASSFLWAEALTPWRTADEYTTESIELAAVQAEEAVQPFLSSRSERRFAGMSVVEVRFIDVRTLTSFRRTRSVSRAGDADVWRLVRRWATAKGDGGLDEAMCRAVAHYLNADFAGLLRAAVLTWIIGEP